MKNAMTLLRSFVRDESGATAVEYGLIATLIAVTILGAIAFTGDTTGNLFNSMANSANNTLTESTGLMN